MQGEEAWVALVTMKDHKMPGVAEIAWAEDKLVLDALAERGVPARHVAWTAPRETFHGAGLIVVRTPWDYTWQLERFLAWTREAEKIAPVWNPPDVIAWNARKSYLFDLAAKGVPIPPTIRVPRGGRADVAQLLQEHGEIVIKPAVDAGAMNAMRVAKGDAPHGQAHLDALARASEVLVQPFLRAINTEGERSLLYFGGEFSHAVRKMPGKGDWRVQEEWGGATTAWEASAADRAAAERAMAAIGPTLHARVDLVTLNDGTPALMELELIEPSLFLAEAPGSAERYARAVEGALRRGREPRARS